MRHPLLAVLPALALAACVKPPDTSGGGSGSGYYPPPDPGGPPSYGCTSDSQCGADHVCARTADCWPASDVHVVHVLWTINGQAPDAASCATVTGLEVDFGAGGGDTSWGYAPVPCSEGKFTVDKMPTLYDFARVSRQDDANVTAGGTIDATTGTVTLDLTL